MVYLELVKRYHLFPLDDGGLRGVLAKKRKRNNLQSLPKGREAILEPTFLLEIVLYAKRNGEQKHTSRRVEFVGDQSPDAG